VDGRKRSCRRANACKDNICWPPWRPVEQSFQKRSVRPQKRPRKECGAAPGKADQAPCEDSADAYHRAYGPPEHFAALNSIRSGPIHATDAAVHRTQQGRGVVLLASLITAAAAVQTAHLLLFLCAVPHAWAPPCGPKRTQVHGVVRGTSCAGDSIFAECTLLRLATGETCDISGYAQDVQVRQWLSGKRNLTSTAAQSVGVAPIGRVAGETGREIADGVRRRRRGHLRVSELQHTPGELQRRCCGRHPLRLRHMGGASGYQRRRKVSAPRSAPSSSLRRLENRRLGKGLHESRHCLCSRRIRQTAGQKPPWGARYSPTPNGPATRRSTSPGAQEPARGEIEPACDRARQC
jgi:hypothetical protein